MKKGLRRLDDEVPQTQEHSNRRPDEEGIKTRSISSYFFFERYSNRRPDEEGIKTYKQSTVKEEVPFQPQT